MTIMMTKGKTTIMTKWNNWLSWQRQHENNNKDYGKTMTTMMTKQRCQRWCQNANDETIMNRRFLDPNRRFRASNWRFWVTTRTQRCEDVWNIYYVLHHNKFCTVNVPFPFFTKELQTDGRTNARTDRQTDRRTDRQTDRQTDRRTERLTDGCTDGRI